MKIPNFIRSGKPILIYTPIGFRRQTWKPARLTGIKRNYSPVAVGLPNEKPRCLAFGGGELRRYRGSLEVLEQQPTTSAGRRTGQRVIHWI